MDEASLEKRLDKIENKLEDIYSLQISTQVSNAQLEARVKSAEEEIKDIKENKKSWLQPLISALVAGVTSWVVSGGLAK